MDLQNLQLTKGRALVLSGPQGCGKTKIAETIARKAGTYIHANISQVENEHELNDLLAAGADTIIVDGTPSAIPELKHLITSETVLVRRLHGKEKLKVKSPNFVFCSGTPDPIPGIEGDRRFFVVRLES